MFYFDFHLISRGTQHFTGTVSNEATSEMGYPVWPTGRTCDPISSFLKWQGLSQEPHSPHCRAAAICAFGDYLFIYLALYLELHSNTSVQHSELGMDGIWKPLGRAVFYFRTFYMVIPMDTSPRAPLDHYFFLVLHEWDSVPDGSLC